jgi:cyclopropane fatty-acyl-phospholipid synthase-like methyltransferase
MQADPSFKDQLRAAYDSDAKRRAGNASKRSDWKLKARQTFADLAKQESKTTILEIGAGAGLDAKFFKDEDFDVLATDLSPNMVEACKELGLNARVLDLYHFDKVKEHFDAIYSINVLLHIPPEDLKTILTAIHDHLQPNGLFHYGVYGGITKEETFADPTRVNMPRYFSFLDDATLHQAVSPLFDIVHSETIEQVDHSNPELSFQSLLLRKK